MINLNFLTSRLLPSAVNSFVPAATIIAGLAYSPLTMAEGPYVVVWSGNGNPAGLCNAECDYYKIPKGDTYTQIYGNSDLKFVDTPPPTVTKNTILADPENCPSWCTHYVKISAHNKTGYLFIPERGGSVEFPPCEEDYFTLMLQYDWIQAQKSNGILYQKDDGDGYLTHRLKLEFALATTGLHDGNIRLAIGAIGAIGAY